jgi:hypothetical protein
MQFAYQEPYLTAEIAAQYYEVVSAPKKLTIYRAEHALNSDDGLSQWTGSTNEQQQVCQ